MHYVKKLDTAPVFFTEEIKDLENWDDYTVSKKPLREYTLQYEQKYLCIYCESKITSEKIYSHVEHIRPKAKDMYPELTFNYANLAISCNSTCFNAAVDNVKYNCGHIKEDEYTEEMFLNPCEVIDLEAYFQYDFDDFKI